MNVADWLLLIAVLLNAYAFVRHERARRRLQVRRDLLIRLSIFAGWLSRDESGAPASVREAARRALGDDVEVEVNVMPHTDGKVH